MPDINLLFHGFDEEEMQMMLEFTLVIPHAQCTPAVTVLHPPGAFGTPAIPPRQRRALFSLAMPHANSQPMTATATWPPLALGMFKEHSPPQLPEQMMLEFDLVMPQLWQLQCIVAAFHPPGICSNLFWLQGTSASS